jgi:LPXTG-motif cell wall-anchored protein
MPTHSRPVPRAAHRITAVLATAAVAVLGAGGPAGAYDLSTGAYTGATGNNATATATNPSALTVSIAASGANFQVSSVADTLNTSLPTSAMFTPALALTTPSVRMLTNTGTETTPACAAVGLCANRGTMTVTFSRPVTNPTLHLAGIGGNAAQFTNGVLVAQSQVSSVLTLTGSTPAGAVLGTVSAGRANLSATATVIRATDQSTSSRCDTNNDVGNPDPAAAGSTAACGSVRVIGTVQSLTFNVGAVFVATAGGGTNIAGTGDGFSVAVSVPQDFGDAPASYDAGAAASADTADLKLGATVTEDNATVANGNASPNAGATAAGDTGDDGVVLPVLAQNLTTYSTAVTISGASAAGQVCGWIDFNRSGTFTAAERACAAVTAGQTTATLTWTGITGLILGNTYARFRIGYATAATQSPTGRSDSGEIEDYLLPVVAAPAPVANNDTATTPYETPVNVNPLTNDVPAAGTTFDPTSVRLRDAGGNAVTTLTTAAGTYTVNTTTGIVAFAPVQGFVGVALSAPYQVTDSLGRLTTATVTVTVLPPPLPTAQPDTATTPFNTPVTSTVLTNDSGGNANDPLVPASLRLVGPGGALVTTLTTAAGTYTANANGTITFTPTTGFSGAAPPVTYSIADEAGQRATTTYTVTVVAPAAPVANPDTGTTPQNTPITVNPPANDTPGPSGAAIVANSVRLLDAGGNPVTSLTVPGEGTYAVNTGTGAVTFTPLAAFTGTATPVPYRVADTNGATAASTITITVTAVTPTAGPDTATTPYQTPVTTAVLGNDTAGSPAAPLVPGSLRLVDPGTGALVTTLVTPAGTYVANAGGTITFTPADGFTGPAPAVTYSIADNNGTRAASTYTVTVGAPPAATPDTANTHQGSPVTVPVLGNDSPGDDGAGHDGTLVPATVRLIDPAGGDPATTVTVPNVGKYVANADGTVTFTPVPGFSGVTPPLTYQVTDSFGNPTRSTVTVTVAAIIPTAVPDTATTPQNTPVTTDVVANDSAGDPGVPLLPGTLRLVDGDGNLVNTLTTPQGTYAVHADGSITFTPVPGFAGVAPPVTYSVADANGTRAQSTYTVTVRSVPPAAHDDTATTRPGQPVRIPVLGNDAGGSAGLDPATVRLIDPHTGRPVGAVTEPGVGSWKVNPDGSVTFTPARGYHGTAAIRYQVADRLGRLTRAVLRVTVPGPPPAPAPPGNGGLPNTGSDVGLYSGVGALAVLLGGLLLLAARRRRETAGE